MEFLQPASWNEALEAKAAHPEALPIWGGTDVMVDMNFGRTRPGALLDLTGVTELTHHTQENGALRHELLIDERLYLIGAPDSPALHGPTIEFDQLARLPLILPGMPHAIRRQLEAVAAKRRLALSVALEVNAYPAIKSIVLAQRGYTVLPASAMLAEVRAGQVSLAEIAAPAMSQKVVLATSTHHPASTAARAVCRLVKSLVERLKANGGWPARLRD